MHLHSLHNTHPAVWSPIVLYLLEMSMSTVYPGPGGLLLLRQPRGGGGGGVEPQRHQAGPRHSAALTFLTSTSETTSYGVLVSGDC